MTARRPRASAASLPANLSSRRPEPTSTASSANRSCGCCGKAGLEHAHQKARRERCAELFAYFQVRLADRLWREDRFRRLGVGADDDGLGDGLQRQPAAIRSTWRTALVPSLP